ncbi:unnamed protein product [Ostreobium quekettii]|uniref:CW-type domain-containing protein n=1 Tax=Ostreobium quekettii TaxID=121088 RepID=A0A8S1IYM3_9CHLO|nr:unnamed protein product [Ostreobium quekettii]|eukprot:evm.model.scf_1529.2 EVM.evm.TU.scf_1529.2   scf_1529:5968-10085(+)
MARSRFVSLQTLIEQGILAPGPAKLSCSVAGKGYEADLGDNGDILFEGCTFTSPSAFSLYVKRKANPVKRSDDGWSSVAYEGTLLCAFRQEYAKRDGAEELEKRKNKRTKRNGVRKRSATAADASWMFTTTATHSSVSYSNDLELCSPSSPVLSQPSRNPVDRSSDNTAGGRLGVRGLLPFATLNLPPVEPTHRWLECQSCGKWRRMPLHDLKSEDESQFVCEKNSDLRFQSCLAAQEFPDAVIAQLLYHEAVQDFMSNTSRPSLSECQGPEFYEDLADFLQHVLRQDERAQHVRERAIPMDLFSLYKAVVECGGMASHQAKDRHGWILLRQLAKGGPLQLSVPTTCTARVYHQYLVGYERAWATRDCRFESASPPMVLEGDV